MAVKNNKRDAVHVVGLTLPCVVTTHTQEIEFSDHPDLGKARQIIRNIRRRKLYRLADEYILPPDVAGKMPKVRRCCVRLRSPPAR